MYSVLDVVELEITPRILEEEYPHEVVNFWKVDDRYFLYLGTDSIASLIPEIAFMISLGLAKDMAGMQIFETDANGEPLGYVRHDDGSTDADDPVFLEKGNDPFEGKIELINFLNDTF